MNPQYPQNADSADRGLGRKLLACLGAGALAWFVTDLVLTAKIVRAQTTFNLVNGEWQALQSVAAAAARAASFPELALKVAPLLPSLAGTNGVTLSAIAVTASSARQEGVPGAKQGAVRESAVIRIEGKGQKAADLKAYFQAVQNELQRSAGESWPEGRLLDGGFTESSAGTPFRYEIQTSAKVRAVQ